MSNVQQVADTDTTLIHVTFNHFHFNKLLRSRGLRVNVKYDSMHEACYKDIKFNFTRKLTKLF
jgi:hypothetical protein